MASSAWTIEANVHERSKCETMRKSALADELANYAFAYLVTVGDDYHAHTVAVEPVLDAGVFDIGPVGGKTSGNLSAHPGRHPRLAAERARRLHADRRRPRRRLTDQTAARGAPSQGAAGSSTKPGCKDDCHPLEQA
jgi:hypothetical protein